MKILHLATDDKFIDTAYQLFENVSPCQNEVLIFSHYDGAFRYAKNSAFQRLSKQRLYSPCFWRTLKHYDCVILHSMIEEWAVLINGAPKKVHFVWLGWGYDYYTYIYPSRSDMMLDRTRRIYQQFIPQKKAPLSLLKRFKNIVRDNLSNRSIPDAIKKLRFFSPVLQSEYDMITRSGLLESIPPYISWNYGNLEDTLIGHFKTHTISGRNILVGNSASYENNHLEAIDLLSALPIDKATRLLFPLSYGDDEYRDVVLEEGRRRLGCRFDPMMEFMPLEVYIEKIKSCGYVVMNHVRQQGLGNIIIMLYLGAKIFMREECPSYRYFKDKGAVIFTVQELGCNAFLLNDILTAEQVENNRAVLQHSWGRDVINEKTRALIAAATTP